MDPMRTMFMSLPPGYFSPNDKVCKLFMELYRLKPSLIKWNEELTPSLLDLIEAVKGFFKN